MRGEFIILIDGETFGRIYCANTNQVAGFPSIARALVGIRNFMRKIQEEENYTDLSSPLLMLPGQITGFRLFVQGIQNNNMIGFALVDGERILLNDDLSFCALVNREIRLAKNRIRLANNVARCRGRLPHRTE